MSIMLVLHSSMSISSLNMTMAVEVTSFLSVVKLSEAQLYGNTPALHCNHGAGFYQCTTPPEHLQPVLVVDHEPSIYPSEVPMRLMMNVPEL
jgi:hypothetical protein